MRGRRGASPHAAFTIHATNGMLVQRNVAFDVVGSAFYLEDGVEERNVLDGNAAAFIHPMGRRDNCRPEGSIFGPHQVLEVRTARMVAVVAWAGVAGEVKDALRIPVSA